MELLARTTNIACYVNSFDTAFNYIMYFHTRVFFEFPARMIILQKPIYIHNEFVFSVAEKHVVEKRRQKAFLTHTEERWWLKKFS